MQSLERLFNTTMSWIKDLSNEKIIIHNDIDALLCAGFLGEYAKMNNIVGMYDTRIFYLKEDIPDKEFKKQSYLKECIGVDLDLTIEGMRTLGHHMTGIIRQGVSYNVNDIFNSLDNVAKGSTIYREKYPLNEIIFLYSLFGMQPQTDEEIALLVYADSVFTSYRDHMPNVRNWLKKLNQTKILDALDNRYPKIFGIICSRIVPLTKGFGTNKKFKQFTLTRYNPIKSTYEYIGNPQFLIDFINKTMHWSMKSLPNKLMHKKMLYYYEIELCDRNNKDKNTINERLKKLNKVFGGKDFVYSSSWAYEHVCKVTTSAKINTDFLKK